MESQHLNSFAPLLRRLRREAGLTQEGLAEQAGIAWRTVSDLERGVKLPRRHTLALLIEALSLSGERRADFEAAAHRKVGPPDAAPPQAGSAPTSPRPTASSAPLVGRVRELALLDHHVAGQGPPVMLLAGQPGIGKSRLLLEVAAGAAARGWCVLVGGCARGADHQPFAPLLQALQRHLAGRTPAERRLDLRGCAWLVRLLPELAEDEVEPLPHWALLPMQERRLMFDAARRFLANVAGPAGTLLLLDDLQWAGQDALSLLTALLEPMSQAPNRVVGAYRDTEVGPEHPLGVAMAELAERQLVSRHPLGPLSHHEAAELFARLLVGRVQVGHAPAAEALRRAGGVPFFLISYADGLQREGDGDPLAPGVPWDLRQSIQRRVTALQDGVQPVLAAAAVIGRVSPRPLLLAVLARPESEVLNALECACRAGLLEEVGDDAYGFVHDVIREVVEGGLGLGRRRMLHRQVGIALERAPGTKLVEALAYHFVQGGERARAAPYLEQAGDHAEARYAHDAATAQYQNLVECREEQGSAPDTIQALEKLAGALESMGRYGAVLAVLERAADLLRSAGDLDGLGRVEAWIAGVHNAQGTQPAGVARLEAVVELLESHGPSRGLAYAYCMLASLFTTNGQAGRSLMLVKHATAMVQAVGDYRLQFDLAMSHSQALMFAGLSDAALQTVEELVRLTERVNNPIDREQALSSRAWLHESRGEYEPAWRAAEGALALAEQLRIPNRVIWNTLRLGVIAFLMGDWPRARTYIERAAALGREVGVVGGYAYVTPLCDLGRLCLAEGRWAEATHYFETVLAVLADTGERILSLVAHGQLAERDVLRGNPAAAIARLAPLLDRPDQDEPLVMDFILPVLAWAYFELGEMDLAADATANAIGRGRAATCRYGLVHALRVRALILLASEHWVEAAEALEEGLALARSMPYPHGEGRLLYVYGLLEARHGEPAPAQAYLDAALVIFRRLGARHDIEIVERVITAAEGLAT